MIKFIYSLSIGCVLMIITLGLKTSDLCTIIQNSPGIVGQTITFTLDCGTSGTPNVSWDFGDGGGFGKYKVSLTATHTFYTPGVYRVFARIQGEDFPVSVVQTIVKPLSNPRPTHSSTIVMDTSAHRVWTVNADNNSITCIDAKLLTKIAEVPVGKHPRTVALDKSRNAWVTNEDDATISVVSPDGTLLKTIKLPYASRPYGVCFDPLGKAAYVTLQGTGKLLRIDPVNGTVIGETAVGRSPRGIAVSSDGTRLFVSRFVSPVHQGEITEVSPASMSVQRVIPLAFDTTPDFDDRGRGVPNFISSITISPDGSTLWIPSKKDNTARGLFRDSLPLNFDNTVRTIVSRIDLAKNEENFSLRRDINDSELACAVEFSPYGNLAFVAMQGDNRIQALDVYTNARIGSINTELTPQGMVFSPDGSKLFVNNYMARTVQVFDTKDVILSNAFSPKQLASISTITVEKLPAQVLQGKRIFYNSGDERMSKTGYISCGGCHLEGLSDERVWDFTDRGEGFRNTHPLLGRRGMGMGHVHWTANFDEIQDFENDIRNGFGGKGFMSDAAFNAGTVKDPLGDKKAGLSPELDALAAYVQSLDAVHPSPYRNQDGSLTDDGKAGKAIFNKLECNKCHSGPDFTDRSKVGLFHDVGTILPSSGKRRHQPLTGFATPTLKGIWESAPYLHDGSAETLKDVLTVKNPKGKHANTSSLSAADMDKLIAYLLQIDESESGVNSVVNHEGAIPGLKVFPNPARDYVTISCRFLSQQGKCSITITNSYGQLVYKSDMTGTGNERFVSLSIKDFPAGMYIITLLEGNRKSHCKLMVDL